MWKYETFTLNEGSFSFYVFAAKGLMRQLNSEKITSKSIQENSLHKGQTFASHIKQLIKYSLRKQEKCFFHSIMQQDLFCRVNFGIKIHVCRCYSGYCKHCFVLENTWFTHTHIPSSCPPIKLVLQLALQVLELLGNFTVPC